MGLDDTSQSNGLLAAISNAVVRQTAEYTGRGPTKARTTISGDWVFVTLIDTLTKGERSLVANDRADFVKAARREFQMAMEADLVAEIEQLMGRKVLAFLSDNHVEPDVAVEVFYLEPASRG